ncbi:MAG: TatD family hydrolase [Bacteroidales bacterium]|nr:TatD family hydrolase [Candidatus Liminaster caballi]
MIIDTHCHLIDDAFVGEVDAVIERARQADVRKMVLACCDEKEIEPIAELCRRYPDTLYPTIGIHPENMADDIDKQLSLVKSLLDKSEGIVAIGEVGIDLHWDKTRLDDQKKLLVAQTEWAIERDLPMILHIRDAMPEYLALLKDTLYNIARTKGKTLRGILHCYSGSADQAIKAQNYGDFLIGIGGTVTYKKSLVPDVAKAIGLGRIVLETDAPYLAPMPNRGKRNEPAYTRLTCEWLAGLFGCSAEEVAVRTTANAKRILNI